MQAIIIGKRHAHGTNKDGQAYNYDKFIYGVPDEGGIGLTTDEVILEHSGENGLIPLFRPVELKIGMKFGRLRVVGFAETDEEPEPLFASVIEQMRSGIGGECLPEEWDC